jgi:hypothetical protein
MDSYFFPEFCYVFDGKGFTVGQSTCKLSKSKKNIRGGVNWRRKCDDQEECEQNIDDFT